MKNQKAQGAMEYLMTYGWAILIVVVVGVALAALGVFNPTPPAGCSSSLNQLAPTGTFTLATGSLVIQFDARSAMTINTIDVGTAATDATPVVSDANIQAGDRFTVTAVPAGLSAGQNFGDTDATINPITVNVTTGGSAFTASVRCHGQVA